MNDHHNNNNGTNGNLILLLYVLKLIGDVEVGGSQPRMEPMSS